MSDHTKNFEALVQNAVLAGVGVLLMEFKNGSVSTRVIPIEEYAILGNHLQHVAELTEDSNE
jgi:hypothetical protein